MTQKFGKNQDHSNSMCAISMQPLQMEAVIQALLILDLTDQHNHLIITKR